MKYQFILALLILTYSCKEESTRNIATPIEKEKPTVSFTFDDGLTRDIVNYKFEEWNALILNALKEANLSSMFFVTGFNKLDKKGKYLVSEWDKRNHRIANHTFSHPNFNDKNNTLETFEEELLMTDSIIGGYNNYVKYFRFPYLKEGKSKEKTNGIRSILNKHKFRNGYVTIDASDWYVNSRLINQMKYRQKVDTKAFEEFYLNHIIERAKFYESISYQLNGRHIKHTLLLHHNLTSALFLKSLIERFKSEGWNTIDATEAYKDPIYKSVPEVQFAGESLIWSLAKQSGKFENQLRYPAEDSRYEKDEMDRLGL
ncbi:MAG: peptidoglycan/xylan/chitin deacetylase (PgdA/CDA1 family) [Saprospiraceae bacterium]|jgi:peptidoglycan/xylan/chitin deacetylase (PgdA/CDA1 family)